MQQPDMKKAIAGLLDTYDFVNEIEKAEVISDKTGNAICIRLFYKNSDRVDSHVYCKSLETVNQVQGAVT